VFLVVAITTAYMQVVWKDIKKQVIRLTTIDTIFNVISDFWSLLSFSVWWKYPLLFLLALTTWLAILSLNIRNPKLTLKYRLIPIVSVTTPSALTRAIAPIAATAAQGAILPLEPPAPNSSWILDFVGPSIIYTDLQDSIVNAIKNNI
jgi:hypothetical protein